MKLTANLFAFYLFFATISTIFAAKIDDSAIFLKKKNVLIMAMVVSSAVAPCFGGGSSVTIQGSGGVAPYVFTRRKLPVLTFAAGSQTGSSPTKTFVSLTAGVWEFKVTDAVGAVATVQFSVNPPEKIVGTSSIVQEIKCHDGTNGKFLVKITSGGTPPFAISLPSGEAKLAQLGEEAHFYNQPAGNFQPQIVDANNCPSSNVPPVLLTDPPVFSIGNAVTMPAFCEGDFSGKISISTVSGGFPPIYYQSGSNSAVGDANFPHSAMLLSATAGANIVTAYDAHQCFTRDTVLVGATNPLEFQTILPTDAGCKTGGTIEVRTTGGSGIFGQAALYKLPENNSNFFNLMPFSDDPNRHFKLTYANGGPLFVGDYRVEITDSKGCVATSAPIQIGGVLPFEIYGTTVFPTCSGGNDGQFLMTAQGGVPPFSFSLDSINWQNSPNFTGLTAGFYQIFARDAQNCTTQSAGNILEPQPFLATAIVPTHACGSPEIQLQITGGTNFNYSIQRINCANSTPIGSPFLGIFGKNVVKNLTTSTPICFKITDEKGCVAPIVMATIPANQVVPPIKIDSLLIQNLDCATDYSGKISFKSVQGGSGLYYFSVDGSPYFAPSSSAVFDNLPATTHYFNIKDADANYASCRIDSTFVLTEPERVAVQTTIQHSICGVGMTAIKYEFCGGTAPFQVELWDFDAINTYNYLPTNPPSIQNFSNLASCPQKNAGQFDQPTVGEHQIIVTDAHGCKAFDYPNFTPVLPPEVVDQFHFDNLCFGEKKGLVRLLSKHGTPPFTFQIDQNATIDQFNNAINLAAGTYHVTATDVVGCTDSVSFTITQPAQPFVLTSNYAPISCLGGSTNVTISASGGNGYSFGAGVFEQFAGTKIYAAYDSAGCQASAAITIADAPAISLIISKLNAFCNATANGKIGVIAQGGAGGFSFRLNSGNFSPNASFSNLPVGDYLITVKDANGCTSSKTVQIGVANAVFLAAQITNNLCAGEMNGQILANASNGALPFQFKLGSGAFQTSGNFPNLLGGSYILTAKDANGCSATTVANVLQPTPIELSTTILNPIGTAKGYIKILASGGKPSFKFQLNSGIFQNSGNFSNLPAGNYVVTVKDLNGCSISKTVVLTLTNNNPILISVPRVTPVTCFGDSSGAILVNVSGCPPLTFKWFKNNELLATTNNLANIPAGKYDVHVTGGCGFTVKKNNIIVGMATQTIDNLTVEDNATCFLKYKWDAKPNVTGYQVVYGKCGDYLTPEDIGLNTNYTILNTQPASCYNFNVYFFGKNCRSDSTAATTATTATLNPPVQVSHVFTANSAVNIKWSQANCSTNNQNAVEIRYRKTGVANWTVVTLTGGVLSHNLAGLILGGCYQYRLRNRFPSGLYSNFTSLRLFCLPLVSAAGAETQFENDFIERNNDVISIEFDVPDDLDSLTEKQSTRLDFSIFPNPASSEIQIYFESILEDKPLTIHVLNIAGEKLNTLFFEKTVDLFDLKINIENLPSGLYLIEIRYGEARKVMKFVKI